MIKMNANAGENQPRKRMRVGYWSYSPIASPPDIKLLDFPNINISLDRVGITVTSRELLSSARYLGTDEVTDMHPRNITRSMRNRLDDLMKQGYDVEQKRERFMDSDHSVPGHLVQLDHLSCGPITARVIEWYPFSILIYMNFNRMLRRHCDRHGIHYKIPEGQDNVFEELDVPEGAIPTIAYHIFDQDRLMRDVVDPVIHELLPDFHESYKNASISFNQVEIPHEIKMKTPWEAEETVFTWMIANARLFKEWRIEEKDGIPIFHAKMLDGLRLKLNWMKNNGFDRRTIKPLMEHAQEIYQSLAKLTRPVKLRGYIPRDFIKHIKNFFRSEKDTDLLRAIYKRVGTNFKNKDLQDMTKLSRHQIYHRIDRKFSWLVSRVEKIVKGITKKTLFWHVPAIGKHALDKLIRMLEEVGSIFEMIQNPDIQPTYMSVLSTFTSSGEIQTKLNQFGRDTIP
ncbi:MAG: hypothetical protein A7316_03590 [Candidatus Altiarchaeales archaeon WOR_SM1_86-2]|nr:MAG: hypothetical protein A7316_03590 [Candidatus Altiarchaeales archaeon WOR_SM1_86-2]